MFRSSAFGHWGFASRFGGGHCCKCVVGFRDMSVFSDMLISSIVEHQFDDQYDRGRFDRRLSKVSAALMQ